MTDLCDVAAEQIVLGSMMLDRSVIDGVCRRVTAEAFSTVAHVIVFRSVVAAYDAGDPTDPVAVQARLVAAGELSRVGGTYLVDLIQAVPTAVQAGWYADRVAAAAMARALDLVGVRARGLAPLAMTDPTTAIQRVQNELDSVGVRTDAADPVRWADLVDPGLASIEAAGQSGSSTAVLSPGLVDLDRVLGGGLREGVTIVAGRPGIGKSVLARNLARAAAFDAKVPTLLFTLEMSRFEVFNSILAAELHMQLNDLNTGTLSDNDWARLAHYIGRVGDVPLLVDDTPNIGLPEIRAKARIVQKRYGLGLVVVDYVQLVQTAARENRQVAVSELSRGFRTWAAELGIPVVLVAQLNRGPEMRADKRPSKADLRESGSLENDASAVILVHRDDYYDQISPRRGEADLIVDKNRHGPQGTVTVASQLHYSRFVSMAV
jgi:replicative DNA helicase